MRATVSTAEFVFKQVATAIKKQWPSHYGTPIGSRISAIANYLECLKSSFQLTKLYITRISQN